MKIGSGARLPLSESSKLATCGQAGELEHGSPGVPGLKHAEMHGMRATAMHPMHESCRWGSVVHQLSRHNPHQQVVQRVVVICTVVLQCVGRQSRKRPAAALTGCSTEWASWAAILEAIWEADCSCSGTLWHGIGSAAHHH